MAMEKDYIVHDTHTKSITALGCNPARRELYLGFEDGCIKSLELDTGNLIQTYNEHKGWITSFMFWSTAKLLFSSSNDCVVCAIGSGGNLMDKIYIGVPVYCMGLNNKRKEIILGVSNAIQFHTLSDSREGFAHFIDPRPNCIVKEHYDIVRCLSVLDSRVYTAGYDGVLCIYDCHFTGKQSAVKFYRNTRAHDAGINCMKVEKDSAENQIWIFTGSFDKSLKLWTGDGKLIHKFDGFLTGVSGICYIPKNKTVCCVAAGTNQAFIYDPKTGEEITDFIDTFKQDIQDNVNLQLLKYLPDFNAMLATTTRRQLILYRYNSSGPITCIKYKQTLDSLCFTNKSPILVFTGDSSGQVVKWEQKHSNNVVFMHEVLLKSEFAERESSKIQGPMKALKDKQQQLKKIEDQKPSYGGRNMKRSNLSKRNDATPLNKKTNIILRLLYWESMDLIFGACEDASIYVWGFDQEALKLIKNVKITTPEEEEDMKLRSINEYMMKLNEMDQLMQNGSLVEDQDKNFLQQRLKKNSEGVNNDNTTASDSVANRVAGYVLKKILCEHTSCVTSLVVVERNKEGFLLSAGWDRRICIWELENIRLYDIFRNKTAQNFDEIELASDGNILDICYSPKLNQFAYACSDTMCYIRKFSKQGAEMKLVNTLQGHLSEVNCIKWLESKESWVTGGEDGTIRLWNSDGEQMQLINCHAQINQICFDLVEGVLMAACHDTIKVYDLDEYHLVQVNAGHFDSIRDIIHVPEKKSIISVSWDKTIRVWRAYKKQQKVRKSAETEKKFETWVFDAMKQALKNSQPPPAPTHQQKQKATNIDEDSLVVTNSAYLTDMDISNLIY